MVDFNLLIMQIDASLAELGVSGLVDAKKARDQLIDLRLMCMSMAAEDPPAVIPVADPALLTEIPRP